MPSSKRYRVLGWAYVITFILFFIARGRGYYLSPIYPMLMSAGAVVLERWFTSLAVTRARLLRSVTVGLLVVSGLLIAALVLPLAPINSAWWDVASSVNGELKEEIGWKELVQTVADTFKTLPAEEKSTAGIYAGNYGEAGAINLYGPALGLPKAISGINSYWLRGYSNPPPQTVIVLGEQQATLTRIFESCELKAPITNRYGIRNEEAREYPGVFVCRRLRQPLEEFWKSIRHFG